MNKNNINPRWGALIDDKIVIAPSKTVSTSVMLELAGLNPKDSLFRDFNTPVDIELTNNQNIDLSEGNVFYTRRKCKNKDSGSPKATPKFAFFVDDRFEIVTVDRVSYNGFCGLFKINNIDLYRDYESPKDELIEENSVIYFKDGPTFYTKDKKCKNIKIIVNGREKVVQKVELSYKEIVELAFGSTGNNAIVYTVTYSKGPEENKYGDMVSGDVVKIKEGMVFNVTATSRS